MICPRNKFFLLVVCGLLLGGCRQRQDGDVPSVRFGTVPPADKGGTSELGHVEGRVAAAGDGRRIVLFARSGAWYVQPFADRPFTEIEADSTWKASTHLGTEYAALLVEPEYRPPSVLDVLPGPGGGIVAVAVVDGEPPFWQKGWLRLSAGLAGAFALLAFYRFRLRRLTRQLNVRFEERLAERTRIAQDLHDTLLQGLVGASMQLDVAVDGLPADAPARAPLKSVQQLMSHVIKEGQNTVRGLRSGGGASLDLGQAFSRVRQGLDADGRIDFRVSTSGRARPLHPFIRDEIYRIGVEALANAFRHAHAGRVEVEVKYADNGLRVMVRDDGQVIDPQAPREGRRSVSAMRERVERIGGRLKVRCRHARGTEVELSIPGHVAFRISSPARPPGWLAGLRKGREERRRRRGSEEDQ